MLFKLFTYRSTSHFLHEGMQLINDCTRLTAHAFILRIQTKYWFKDSLEIMLGIPNYKAKLEAAFPSKNISLIISAIRNITKSNG